MLLDGLRKGMTQRAEFIKCEINIRCADLIHKQPIRLGVTITIEFNAITLNAVLVTNASGIKSMATTHKRLGLPVSDRRGGNGIGTGPPVIAKGGDE
jgi:hypothetical protein